MIVNLYSIPIKDISDIFLLDISYFYSVFLVERNNCIWNALISALHIVACQVLLIGATNPSQCLCVKRRTRKKGRFTTQISLFSQSKIGQQVTGNFTD